jgi:hypothetical protein
MNPKLPSTSRLTPSTNHTPLTKEQIKRRSFWVNFVMHGFHFAIWIIFTVWLYNGGRPK